MQELFAKLAGRLEGIFMQLSQGGRAAKARFWSTHREIMDAAVIFAIAVMACGATIYFNGLEQLHNLSREYQGWELNAVTSVLLFSGIALSVYGMRRMADQRREKKRRRAAERHAHALALKDPLTRLPNRVRFEQEVAAALSTAQDAGTTVLLMGLVGLQGINDAHGYAGGDTVVAQVAARLRESVGAEGLLARFGDDAFAVCLRSNDPHKAGKVAAAMLECLNDPVAIGEDEQRMEAAIGIAQTCSEQLDAGELVRRAHVALNRGKSTNDAYCFFDADTDAHVREQSFLDWVWTPRSSASSSA
jgi:diguanylate cyclase (GGDEF)-like protein